MFGCGTGPTHTLVVLFVPSSEGQFIFELGFHDFVILKEK